MASSGRVTLTTQSVDYPCCPYGRGHITLTNVIGWNVNDSGDISFNLISSSDTAGGSWFICTSGSTYYVELVPQVSYSGGSSWTNLDTKRQAITTVCCPSGTCGQNTIQISTTLINQLGTYHLSGNCQLRFLYYMTVAPAPSSANPNAFPNSSYSEVSQVPVVVEVNWNARLKYDANGGSGAPGDQTASVPQATTSKNFTVSSTRPTWGDYIFLGWSTIKHTRSCTEEDVEYRAGDTFTVQKSNPTRTLYAVWMKDYRPGARKVGTAWSSHNKEGGKCHIKQSNNWVEMRTIDGGATTNNPPQRFYNGSWRNQYKLGSS